MIILIIFYYHHNNYDVIITQYLLDIQRALWFLKIIFLNFLNTQIPNVVLNIIQVVDATLRSSRV